MPQGDKILASEYNGWWTTLNAVRSKFGIGTVGVTTVGTGTTATANNINTLINQVNSLATFYSGADWANFTESTKTVGQLIQYPDKMEYMLNYLNNVCLNFANFSTNVDFTDFANFSTNVDFTDFANFSTNVDFTDFADFSTNVYDSFSSFSDFSTDVYDSFTSFSEFSTNSNFSNFSTNSTEGPTISTTNGFSLFCQNNGTCTSY